jgi:hypothetical protein
MSPSHEVVTAPGLSRIHTPLRRSSGVEARRNPSRPQAVSSFDWLCPVQSSNFARVAGSLDMSLVRVFGSTFASCVHTHCRRADK